jgi:TP901 family phage tail tape measure protein
MDKNLGRTTSRLGQFRSGAVASLASLTGLRGAVLAASGPFLLAAVATTAFLKSLQEFANFEQELNVFSATVEATGEEMEKVSALAKELGADLTLPSVSASDAAAAMTELARAGLSVEDAMAGARGVLQLSTAAGISTGEAAQFAANELNAFSLAGDQAIRVADVLANAANAAQGNIQDFGLAFKQSAAVANQVGLSLEATAAQLAIMARAGLQGSDAGTSLRVALLRLINPTKAAQAVIQQLGIDLRDVNGNIRPDVFVQFAEATRQMAPALRDANAAIVFGADGIRTLAVSAQAGREGLVDATIAIGEQGTAAELAQARTAGFGGQLEGLSSTAQTAAVNLGEVSTVVAGPLVASLTVLAAGLNRALEPFADLVRLSKEKLGLGTFDPATQSASELIEKLRQTREEMAASSSSLRSGFTAALQTQTEDAIRALEAQRAVLKALGVDVSGITALIVQLQRELEATGGSAVSGLTTAEKALRDLKALFETSPNPGLRNAIEELQNQIFLAAQEGGRFTERFDQGLRNATGSADALAAALGRLRGEIAASSDELLRAQNQGASPQAQIAILQGQEQTQQDIIANLKANGIQAGDPSAIRAAREEIERIQGQIESLQNGIVADQKAAATAAEKAAKEAQEARDKQFEAIAEMFGGRQGNIENAIERAGIEGNVEAVIRLNKALIASLQKERAALLERLKTLKVSNDVRKKILQAINDAIEEAQQDILRAQQDTQDNLQKLFEPIDLRIRIAQAQDNEAREIALRRKKVELISKELAKLKNAGKKNTKQWLELKAQLAEENAAIRELEKQDKTDTKTARQSAAEFFFEQLQAQQGFASNLLGNLITGPTEGLVGVPSPTTGPGPGITLAANVGQGKEGRGPTSGQASTTNDLLLRILHQLKNLNGSQSTPEAKRQYRVGQAGMDGAGNVNGI